MSFSFPLSCTSNPCDVSFMLSIIAFPSGALESRIKASVLLNFIGMIQLVAPETLSTRQIWPSFVQASFSRLRSFTATVLPSGDTDSE